MATPATSLPSDSTASHITAATPPSQLPTDVATLQQMVVQLLGQIDDKTREAFDLKCQLEWCKRQLFGRKSEKLDPNQRLLFEHLIDDLEQRLEQHEPPAEPAAPCSGKKTAGSEKPSRRNGRVPLPAHLPRVREYRDPDPREIEGMHCIGEDVTEILEYIPAGVYVRQIVRRKYAPADGSGPVVMAPLPARPIEKGRPSPSVMAHIIVSKYNDHLPLYRQEQIFQRYGVQIPRSTQCDWVGAGSDLLCPIVQAMKREILGGSKVYTDDTYIPVQDKSRTQVRRGYLWPYIDDAGNVYFDYTTARSRAGPEAILAGYQGTVQADAFSGYDHLYGPGKAREAGCWGHARRKFDEALQTDALRANQMLALIAELYVVERKGKEEGYDADEIKALRQAYSKPILTEQIKPLLDRWQGEVLPRSPLGKAVTYALNQWGALLQYLEDGLLSIDNSLAERVIKLVALGRKNWLFAGSDAGAQRAAVLYSLIASCRLCRVDPFLYLRDVLDRVNTHPASRIDELTPPRWKELFQHQVEFPRLAPHSDLAVA